MACDATFSLVQRRHLDAGVVSRVTHRLLALPVPPNFSLAQSICSYGYFCLAPNRWHAASSASAEDGFLMRPLRYGKANQLEHNVAAVILQGQKTTKKQATTKKRKRGDTSASGVSRWDTSRRVDPSFVLIAIPRCHEPVLTEEHEEQLRAQVHRMVRAEMDGQLLAFHAMHPVAKHRGYGRTYRSPTLFEDLVKTLTNCNVNWKRTIRMNELLCQHYGNGSFPTAHELAAPGVDADTLKAKCNVGYRAPWIYELAQSVVDGSLDLVWLESTG